MTGPVITTTAITLREFTLGMQRLYPGAVCHCRIGHNGVLAEYKGGGVVPPVKIFGYFGPEQPVEDALIYGGDCLLEYLSSFEERNLQQLRMLNGP